MQKKVTAQKNKYKGEPCWGKWQGALGPTTGCILQDPWMGSIHTNTFSWHSVYYLTICRENSLQSLCLSSPSATEKRATRTALNQELRKTTKHTLLLTPLLPRMIFIFSVGAFRHLAVLSWAGIICEGKERKGKMLRRSPAAQQDDNRSLHFLLETPRSWNKLNIQ